MPRCPCAKTSTSARVSGHGGPFTSERSSRAVARTSRVPPGATSAAMVCAAAVCCAGGIDCTVRLSTTRSEPALPLTGKVHEVGNEVLHLAGGVLLPRRSNRGRCEVEGGGPKSKPRNELRVSSAPTADHQRLAAGSLEILRLGPLHELRTRSAVVPGRLGPARLRARVHRLEHADWLARHRGRHHGRSCLAPPLQTGEDVDGLWP